jgi:hypothetical protein
LPPLTISKQVLGEALGIVGNIVCHKAGVIRKAS